MKTKKRTPFDFYKERIAELEIVISTLRRKEAMKPLVERFKTLLAVQFVNTPYSQWPDVVKSCLQEAGRDFPSLLQDYKRELKS